MIKKTSLITLLSILSLALLLSACGKKDQMPAIQPTQNETPAAVAPTTPDINSTQENTAAPTGQTPKNEPINNVVTKTVPKPSPAPSSSKVYVNITKTGFSPKNATVRVGQSIVFVNKDTSTHWPYSLNYPLFDAGKALKTGESYGFIFKSSGVISVSDKLSDTAKGTITVK